jgi:hypothetical protein
LNKSWTGGDLFKGAWTWLFLGTLPIFRNDQTSKAERFTEQASDGMAYFIIVSIENLKSSPITPKVFLIGQFIYLNGNVVVWLPPPCDISSIP